MSTPVSTSSVPDPARFSTRTAPSRRYRPSRWLLFSTLALVIVVTAVRIALPAILEHQINRRLAHMPGYSGRVGDVDLRLLRGAYRIDDILINKQEGDLSEPFLAAKTVDFSLAWGELFRGKFVGNIALDRAELRFSKLDAPSRDARAEGKKWQELIEDLFPIEITRLEIKDSSLRFVDKTSTPQVDIAIESLHASVIGLRNHADETDEEYPAAGRVAGTTIGGGHLEMRVDGDPLAVVPRFKLKMELTGVDLPAINDFLEAYAGVDVSAGKLDIAFEAVASEGRYEGYFKPFVSGARFTNLQDREKSVLRRAWEKIVSGVANLVENRTSGNVATRIPFSGEFGRTDVGILATIGNLLRNGFGRALVQGVDGDLPELPKQADDSRP